MGKFDGVLFATDLDDTLLDRRKKISLENRAAIEYFRREGGLFTYATGRSRQGFERPRQYLPESGPVVLSNGSVIYDYQKRECLFSCFMDRRSAQVAREVIDRFPQVGMEVYLEEAVCVFQLNAPARNHLERVGISGYQIVDRPEEIPQPWIKGIFVQEPDFLLEVEQYFRQRYGEEFELVFSDPYLLEMQDLAGNKGEGVLRLATLSGITPEHIYVAGDQQNDLSMLKRFQAFVPENGTPEARAQANWIVPDCDESAIAAAIAILEEKYR